MLPSVTSKWLLAVFVYTLLILDNTLVLCTTVDLDWVSYSHLFSASGLQMLQRELRINDRIRFSCSADGMEHAAIHRVSEQEAFSCERFSPFTDSLVGTCTKANDSVIIRLREFPMLPNELSYKPDRDYFFISTSTGSAEGLENSKGSLCGSRKMRVKVHVRPRAGFSTGKSQMNMDSTYVGRDGVMMLPVDARQYPVPVMYVPVSTADVDLLKDGDKRLRLPHLYVANEHLQRHIFTKAHMAGRRGERFDAQDEPSRLFETPNTRDYQREHLVEHAAKSAVLRSEEDRDFEVEYLDQSNRGSHSKPLDMVLVLIEIPLAIILLRR